MDLTAFTGPLVDIVFAAVAAAGSVLIPFILNWFFKKTKLDQLMTDDVIRNYLYEVLDRAIALAKTKIAAQKLEVNVDSVLARFVFDYLKEFVPDALAHFDLTEAKVAEMVKSRLAAEGIAV